MSMQGQGLLLTLAQGHFHIKIETCFSRKSFDLFNQILYVHFKVHGNENLFII